MVKVKSTLERPIELHLDDMRDVGLGIFEARRRRGSETTMRPGVNEVDADFWAAWRAAHDGSPLAAAFVTIEQPKKESPPDPLRKSPSPSSASTASAQS